MQRRRGIARRVFKHGPEADMLVFGLRISVPDPAGAGKQIHDDTLRATKMVYYTNRIAFTVQSVPVFSSRIS
ncbi:hypothetical protein SDC9_148071 [bioreactor metagenome]|uniref:Uncharacterized protein n=1 Tax=bioreactor metagenome TaxID=1076179 RepID=A0A645EJY8_9ZZZZ